MRERFGSTARPECPGTSGTSRLARTPIPRKHLGFGPRSRRHLGSRRNRLGVARVWSLTNFLELEALSAGVLASRLMPTSFVLDARPCPEITPATAAALNDTDGPEEGLSDLLEHLTGTLDVDTDGGNDGERPTYLGFLPHQNNEATFNLVFLGDCYEGRIVAVATLPPHEGTPFVTLVTAIIPSQDFEGLLPAVDQLFASVAPAQSETDRAAEALASYKEQRNW